MRKWWTAIGCLGLTACMEPHPAEDPSGWFDEGVEADVEEAITFTTTPYDFPSNPSSGIAALKQAVFPAPRDAIVFGPDDAWPTNRCGQRTDNDLPAVVEGVVTLHPRYYFKVDGCDRGSDEKFYGSFFVQDSTGGVFVLGDTKTAHFTTGDRVKLRVRAAQTSFDLDRVYAYDLVEVQRVAQPVYYQNQTTPLGIPDIGLVKRITGEVVREMDTFGEVPIRVSGSSAPCEAEDTSGCFFLAIDSDLSRRGVNLPVGTRLEATGPVIYSYSQFAVVIMKRGQLNVLD